MSSKRIFIVSLSTGDPMSLLAGYLNGQLHVVKCESLERNLAQLKKTLPDRIEALKSKGYIVLVDEVIPVFSHLCRGVKLSDIGPDGRPILVSSLQYYKNMEALQAITLPDGDRGLFDIPESIVEEKRDANGKVNYHIDWQALRPESTLLLLAINAAIQEHYHDAPTALQLMKALGAKDTKSAPSKSFQSVVKKVNQSLSVDSHRTDDDPMSKRFRDVVVPGGIYGK